jgi:putative Mg2+ transporter-C (MgtC) family protein
MQEIWNFIQESSPLFFIFKALAAIFVGFLIGMEREWSGKPAGIRTNIMVVLGATIFTIISFEMAKTYNSDATRIASNIVTGIGFLGAGAILHARGAVMGLTTAATLWVNGALGMLIGYGKFIESGIATIFIVVILYGLRRFEQKVNLHNLAEEENDTTDNSGLGG